MLFIHILIKYLPYIVSGQKSSWPTFAFPLAPPKLCHVTVSPELCSVHLPVPYVSRVINFTKPRLGSEETKFQRTAMEKARGLILRGGGSVEPVDLVWRKKGCKIQVNWVCVFYANLLLVMLWVFCCCNFMMLWSLEFYGILSFYGVCVCVLLAPWRLSIERWVRDDSNKNYCYK